MMYILSIAREEMTGMSKGVTAAKDRSCKYIRNKGTDGSFQTTLSELEISQKCADPRMKCACSLTGW